jgi:hypothetical protein
LATETITIPAAIGHRCTIELIPRPGPLGPIESALTLDNVLFSNLPSDTWDHLAGRFLARLRDDAQIQAQRSTLLGLHPDVSATYRAHAHAYRVALRALSESVIPIDVD